MRYENNGNVTIVYDSKERPFIIDTEQIENVTKYKWYVDTTKGYVRRTTDKLQLHRYLLNTTQTVDHINRKKNDNRISNLRVCTIKENNRNKECHKNNKLKVKGVFAVTRYNKTRYRTHIDVDGKRINIGTFDTIEEATKAYNNTAMKYFGEYSPYQ